MQQLLLMEKLLFTMLLTDKYNNHFNTSTLIIYFAINSQKAI